MEEYCPHFFFGGIAKAQFEMDKGQEQPEVFESNIEAPINKLKIDKAVRI